MLLSIIFCINRDNPYLNIALRSVVDQTFPNFELLISANNCSDELYSRLSAFAGTDARVRLFRSHIGQLAYNLNYLADNAKGDYLVRMDADDISHPQRLATLARHIEQTDFKYDIVGSWITVIDHHGRAIRKIRLPTSAAGIKYRLLIGSPFCHPAVAIRRGWLYQARGYLGGFVSEDKDLWIRSQLAGARMCNVPEYLLSYRVHSDQASRSIAGYAESVAHWCREFLVRRSLYTFFGLSISLAKLVSLPALQILNGLRFRLRRS